MPTSRPPESVKVKGERLEVLEEYWEGMEMHDNGFSAVCNPYEPASRKFQAWYLGWFEASQNDAYRG